MRSDSLASFKCAICGFVTRLLSEKLNVCYIKEAINRSDSITVRILSKSEFQSFTIVSLLIYFVSNLRHARHFRFLILPLL